MIYDDEGTFGNAGSVCVFERSGGAWAQVDRLVASDYINSGFFGASVAMSGDTAIFGSYGISYKRGAAYVFVRESGVWTEQQKLTAPDAANLDEFGYAVAVDGDTVVVGAYKSNHSLLTDPGSAYVFTRTGSVWSFEQKLVAGAGQEGARLGYAVALTPTRALVTVPFADHDTVTDAGAACSYDHAGQLFADGFESGDPAAWSATAGG